MQAIALSLQDSAGFLNLANEVPTRGNDADSTKKDSNEKASLKKVGNQKATLKKAGNKKEVSMCNQEDATGKRKRKQEVCYRLFTKSMKILNFLIFLPLYLSTLQLFSADKKSSADD